MAKMKKTKLDKPSLYTPNNTYKMPMTPEQQTRYNKLSQNPKTGQTMFTLPKGTEKLSAAEKKQIQARRLLDRKRTLTRAAAVIRRDTGVKTVVVNSSKSTSKPKPKSSKPKTIFGK
jgi:hypothetical protein